MVLFSSPAKQLAPNVIVSLVKIQETPGFMRRRLLQYVEESKCEIRHFFVFVKRFWVPFLTFLGVNSDMIFGNTFSDETNTDDCVAYT